jgi:hypothetical protein
MTSDKLERLITALDQLEMTSGEEADCVVCRLITTPLLMPDNLVGHCSLCHRMIQHRPHAPKGPPKVCDECGFKNMAKDGDARVVITEQSKADLQGFLKKMREH